MPFHTAEDEAFGQPFPDEPADHSTVTEPTCGARKPDSRFINLVLPHPHGPRTAMNCPGRGEMHNNTNTRVDFVIPR